MPPLPLEQQTFLVIQTAALIGLCIRFLWTGLHRIYVWFFVYLLLALLQTAVLGLVPLSRHAYVLAWEITEGLIVSSYALIVLEAYSLLLRNLTGIASVSRRYIKVTLAAGVVAGLSLTALEKTPKSIFNYFLICDRVMISSLVFFVLLSTIFLAYYPVPLNRNVVAYSIGYAIYFLTKATVLLIANMGSRWWQRGIDSVLIGTSTACLLFWLYALNRQGETKTVVVGHRWNREEEQRVLAQLEAINRALLRRPGK
jgi:hypothetical protein